MVHLRSSEALERRRLRAAELGFFRTSSGPVAAKGGEADDVVLESTLESSVFDPWAGKLLPAKNKLNTKFVDPWLSYLPPPKPPGLLRVDAQDFVPSCERADSESLKRSLANATGLIEAQNHTIANLTFELDALRCRGFTDFASSTALCGAVCCGLGSKQSKDVEQQIKGLTELVAVLIDKVDEVRILASSFSNAAPSGDLMASSLPNAAPSCDLSRHVKMNGPVDGLANKEGKNARRQPDFYVRHWQDDTAVPDIQEMAVTQQQQNNQCRDDSECTRCGSELSTTSCRKCVNEQQGQCAPPLAGCSNVAGRCAPPGSAKRREFDEIDWALSWLSDDHMDELHRQAAQECTDVAHLIPDAAIRLSKAAGNTDPTFWGPHGCPF